MAKHCCMQSYCTLPTNITKVTRRICRILRLVTLCGCTAIFVRISQQRSAIFSCLHVSIIFDQKTDLHTSFVRCCLRCLCHTSPLMAQHRLQYRNKLHVSLCSVSQAHRTRHMDCGLHYVSCGVMISMIFGTKTLSNTHQCTNSSRKYTITDLQTDKHQLLQIRQLLQVQQQVQQQSQQHLQPYKRL